MEAQLSLFETISVTGPVSDQIKYHFMGADYDPERDGKRLEDQIYKIRDLMMDGRWRTVDEICDIIKAPATSVSAQLRNLRKDAFGGFTVLRRRREAGCVLSEYKIEI